MGGRLHKYSDIIVQFCSSQINSASDDVITPSLRMLKTSEVIKYTYQVTYVKHIIINNTLHCFGI